MKQNNS